jgi:hypothetical protein
VTYLVVRTLKSLTAAQEKKLYSSRAILLTTWNLEVYFETDKDPIFSAKNLKRRSDVK